MVKYYEVEDQFFNAQKVGHFVLCELTRKEAARFVPSTIIEPLEFDEWLSYERRVYRVIVGPKGKLP